MMSQCMVPNWKLRHQRQEQVGGEEGNRSSHVNSQLQNHSRLVPMSSNHEVAELTWENGQLAMHELGGLLPTGAPTKQQTWGTMGTSDNTLESIVHQATTISQQQKQNQNIGPQQHGRNNIPAAENNPSSTVASSAGKWAKPSGLLKKRMRSESDQSGRYNNNNNIIIIQEEFADRSASASASATVCRDNDTTAMTWASFESPQSLKTKATDEDSACHDDSENLDEERETKGELTGRSHPTRRSRAAAVHNQSERRRRDRINQKMKTLQKLVPNASKSDKASMLDEVIDYLKQLQAQLRMMMMSNNARSMHMPQMMMPMGIQAQQQQQQQQIQMSMQLARMAMGVGPGSIPMGMGIGIGTGIPQSLPQLIHHPPPFVVPPMIPNHTPQPQPTTHQDAAAAISNSFPFNHPYYAFLAQQSMNMDLCNKMAEIYRQQVSQSTTPPRSNPSPSSHAQRG